MTKDSIDRQIDLSWKNVWNDPTEVINVCSYLIHESEKINYKRGIAYSLRNIALAHRVLMAYPESLKYCDEVLQLEKELNDKKLYLRMSFMKADNYRLLGDTDTALQLIDEAYESSKEENDLYFQGMAHQYYGIIFGIIGNIDGAINSIMDSLKVLKGVRAKELKMTGFLSLSYFYYGKGKYKLGVESANKAIALARKINNKARLAHGLCHKGKNSIGLGNCKTAYKALKEACRISKNNNLPNEKYESLHALSIFYLKQRKFKKAIHLMEEAKKIVETEKAKPLLEETLYAFVEIYEEKGDYINALKHYKEFHQIHEELANENTRNKLSSLSLKLELEFSKRESEIYREKNAELEISYNQMHIINEIGKKIATTLIMKEIFFKIHDYVKALMNTDVFGIGLVDNERKKLSYKYFIENGKSLDIEDADLDSEVALSVWCIKHKEYVFINDLESEYSKYLKQLPEIVEGFPFSIIYTPLIVENNVIGVITVQSFNKNSYSPHDVNMLQILASYIGIAINNSMIMEQVQQLHSIVVNEKKELEKAYTKIKTISEIDYLTKLYNRRTLLLTLESFIKNEGEAFEFVILYLDLDSFKNINDTYGHEIGDLVLIETANRLKKCVRTSDIIARVGGDEFIAVLIGTKRMDIARRSAEKALDTMALPMNIQNHEISLTISIGISIYPDDDKQLSKIIDKADNAMYKIKHASKNNYLFYKKQK